MKTARTIERLRQVVRVLEGLPEDAGFNLTGWWCGTSACAAGWAAQDPWFKRRRFTLTPTRTQPVFRGRHGFQAVREFFGLDLIQSRALFSSNSYKRGSKQDVIDRVNAFCNKLERVSQ